MQTILIWEMLFRTMIPAAALTVSAFSADLAKIPFETADGEKASLGDYKGKVVLLVNVASKCGFTTQYEGLEKLYRARKGDGLVILAFPCNDFGNQEPGSIEEIEKFCKTNYDVTFPIMGKLSVKGKTQHKLYEALTGPEGAFPGDVKWNFGKILIGKDGKPLARFESATTPDSPELTQAITDALGK
ncbi:MAG: glutathione peroxidase [Armatimonadetes bacterium]|nr:glutathione peroxidase [Akkermansiaceae bacterium]